MAKKDDDFTKEINHTYQVLIDVFVKGNGREPNDIERAELLDKATSVTNEVIDKLITTGRWKED